MNAKLKQALKHWHDAEVKLNQFDLGMIEARKGACERARDNAKAKLLKLTREVFKLKTTLVALLLCAFAPLRLPAEVPPFQTKTFEFVPPSATNQIILFRIYTVSLPNFPGTTNFIGTTTSNRFAITNLLAAPVRVYVASSNVWGEGDWCIPYEMPTRPAPPTELKPVSTRILVPFPGIMEGSFDLALWHERMTFRSADGQSVSNINIWISHTTAPESAQMFWRAKTLPAAVKPPPLP